MASGPPTKFVDRTEEALATVTNAAHGRVRHAAELSVAFAKEPPAMGGAPVLTGHLRDSIDFEEKGDCSFRVFTETAGIESLQGYGGLVHLENPFITRNVRRAFKKLGAEGEWV